MILLHNIYNSKVGVYLAKGNQVILSISPLLAFFLQPFGKWWNTTFKTIN